MDPLVNHRKPPHPPTRTPRAGVSSSTGAPPPHPHPPTSVPHRLLAVAAAIAAALLPATGANIVEHITFTR